MFRQALDNLDLFKRAQTDNRLLNHHTNIGLVYGDEALVIHEGEEAHDKLTIHAVRHTAVPRDAVAKVLDLERALQSASEEAAKGRYERGECCKDERVEMDWRKGHGDGQEMVEGRGERGKKVGAWEEDGVGCALETRENIGAEVLLAALMLRLPRSIDVEVLGLH